MLDSRATNVSNLASNEMTSVHELLPQGSSRRERSVQQVSQASADGLGFAYPATQVGATGNITVYYDPALGPPGLSLAQQFLSAALGPYNDMESFFGTSGGQCNVIIAPLSGNNDGSGGAFHYGCDFSSGGALYLDATFANNGVNPLNLEVGLYVAELSECFMGLQNRGWGCGFSNGEGLSRFCAEYETPLDTLDAFATGPAWAQAGFPDWVTNTEQTDRNGISTGCAIVYIYWMRSLGFSVPQIVQAGGATLAANYSALTGKNTAYQDLRAALEGFSVTSDNPFIRLGMSTAMGPASAGRTGNLFIFTVASTNGRILFNQIAPGGDWAGVQELPGGFVTDAPVAAGMQGTTLFVFAKDTQGQLHFTRAPQGGAFTPWEAVPGMIKTSLAPASAGRTGNLFVFAVESSGQIAFDQIAPGGNFVGWQTMPGGMTTATAVAAGMQGDTLFVFAKDNVGQLHFTKAPQGGAFAAWQGVPGGLITPAAPASAGRAGNLFIFAEKNDGSIAFNQIGPGGPFIGWQSMPSGVITDAPVAAGMQGTTLFVFAKDKQGVVHFVEAQAGGAFSAWRI
jgi:hypothetical protein